MDAGIILAFKRHYRRYHLQNALYRDERRELELYKVDQLAAMRWSLAAWEEITSRKIANGFRHTGLFEQEEQQEAAQTPVEDFDELAVGQELQAAIDELPLRNLMSIENLLNPIEEDEAAHPELDNREILAYVQDAEDQEEEAPEEEEVVTLTKADKLPGIGIFCFFA